MSVDSLILLLGAFVAIEPQLGFPQTWDTVLLTIAGLIILALGIVVRRRGLIPKPQSTSLDTHSENVSASLHDAQQ